MVVIDDVLRSVWKWESVQVEQLHFSVCLFLCLNKQNVILLKQPYWTCGDVWGGPAVEVIKTVSCGFLAWDPLHVTHFL